MSIRRTGFLSLLAMLALPALAAAPAAENATGKWLATVDAMGMPMELTFELKAEGEKLTGTMSMAGAPIPPAEVAEGKVKGEDVSFKLAIDTGQGGPPLSISYVGKLKGDTMTLQSSFSMGDGAEPMVTELVATRSK
jgi:hypothetical protein